MLRNINSLVGCRIHATDGELGKVAEFYFGDKTWNIRYMVVETGNWLSGRKVLISPAVLKAPDWKSKVLPVALTKEQVRTSPDIDTKKTVTRQHELELQKHYAWESYGQAGFYAGGMSGGFMFPAHPQKPETADPAQPKEDTHLQGTHAVTGYKIHATDGTIGRVEDYIVDDVTWGIRYLVVDAAPWLSGRKVLIAPRWIKSVSWETSEVFVDLPKAAISNSPAYDPSVPVNENYESVLDHHYGALGLLK